MTDQIATSPRPDTSKKHKHAQAEYDRSAALRIRAGPSNPQQGYVCAFCGSMCRSIPASARGPARR
jgi:hypothetical protein